MSEIVKTVGRILSPLILLFGIYIAFHGHLTPGGGFAGGVIISASIVLIVLAYGGEEKLLTLKKNITSSCESLGILFFWLVALLGLIFGGVYFINFLGNGDIFHLFSSGIILLCNIAIGIEVGGAIAVIVLAFILFKE